MSSPAIRFPRSRRLGLVPPPAFQCSWTCDVPHVAWVHATGELDLSGLPDLRETLRECISQARLVVLDLRELLFIDSTGVQAIADATRQARRTGRRLIVLRGPPDVDRVFVFSTVTRGLEFNALDRRVPPVQVLLQLPSAHSSPSA